MICRNPDVLSYSLSLNNFKLKVDSMEAAKSEGAALGARRFWKKIKTF
jgi:hypothetical protein